MFIPFDDWKSFSSEDHVAFSMPSRINKCQQQVDYTYFQKRVFIHQLPRNFTIKFHGLINGAQVGLIIFCVLNSINYRNQTNYVHYGGKSTGDMRDYNFKGVFKERMELNSGYFS